MVPENRKQFFWGHSVVVVRQSVAEAGDPHKRFSPFGWDQAVLECESGHLTIFEANSAVRFLIDRWGMARVDELLTAFKARESVATALESKLFVSYEQFQARWLDTFQHKRT